MYKLYPILLVMILFIFLSEHIYIYNVLFVYYNKKINNNIDQYYIFHGIKYYIDLINITRVMGILLR